jgi:hypothetical protein
VEKKNLRKDLKSDIILSYTTTKSKFCISSHTQNANLSMLLIDTILGPSCTQQLAKSSEVQAGRTVGINVSDVCALIYQKYTL